MDIKLNIISTKHCSQCKLLHKELDENPLGIDITYVDADELSDEFIDSLNIRSIPVIFLMKKDGDDWKEINRWVGFTKANVIETYIEELCQ